MSLVHYSVEYKSVPLEQRKKLLEEIEAYSSIGAIFAPDFCSCEFFLEQNVDVHIINFPDGSHLNRL